MLPFSKTLKVVLLSTVMASGIANAEQRIPFDDTSSAILGITGSTPLSDLNDTVLVKIKNNPLTVKQFISYSVSKIGVTDTKKDLKQKLRNFYLKWGDAAKKFRKFTIGSVVRFQKENNIRYDDTEALFLELVLSEKFDQLLRKKHGSREKAIEIILKHGM